MSKKQQSSSGLRCSLVLILLAFSMGLAGCDNVQKACQDCCDIPLIRGICTEGCVKIAEKMNMSPSDVRRDCPGRR